jgi:hypothetical protein
VVAWVAVAVLVIAVGHAERPSHMTSFGPLSTESQRALDLLKRDFFKARSADAGAST